MVINRIFCVYGDPISMGKDRGRILSSGVTGITIFRGKFARIPRYRGKEFGKFSGIPRLLKISSQQFFKFSKSINPFKSYTFFIYIYIFLNNINILGWKMKKKMLSFWVHFKKLIFQKMYLLKTDNFWMGGPILKI